MVLLLRSLAVVTLLAMPVVGFSAAESGSERKEEKKFEMPPIVGVTPKWDLTSIEEKFTIIKAGINTDKQLYFLLELKEDMAQTPSYEVVFVDDDGVKFNRDSASCYPNMGKKGDRVRLMMVQPPENQKDRWAKTVLVKITEK